MFNCTKVNGLKFQQTAWNHRVWKIKLKALPPQRHRFLGTEKIGKCLLNDHLRTFCRQQQAERVRNHVVCCVGRVENSKILQGCLGHRINTQPEVRLRVGAFHVGVLVFLAAAIFLASVHGKCLRYTEDVDVVFTKKNSSLLTLERGRWIRMLCDSSNLHKQKLVKPKPLASKMAAVKKVGQKNGEVELLTSGWVSILCCCRMLS